MPMLTNEEKMARHQYNEALNALKRASLALAAAREYASLCSNSKLRADAIETIDSFVKELK